MCQPLVLALVTWQCSLQARMVEAGLKETIDKFDLNTRYEVALCDREIALCKESGFQPDVVRAASAKIEEIHRGALINSQDSNDINDNLAAAFTCQKSAEFYLFVYRGKGASELDQSMNLHDILGKIVCGDDYRNKVVAIVETSRSKRRSANSSSKSKRLKTSQNNMTRRKSSKTRKIRKARRNKKTHIRMDGIDSLCEKAMKIYGNDDAVFKYVDAHCAKLIDEAGRDTALGYYTRPNNI